MGFFRRNRKKNAVPEPLWHVAEYDGDWPTAPGGTAAPVDETPIPAKPRRRWRWLKWSFYGGAILFFVTIIWLVVTAPLGRALEPLDDPAMLFVSAEGSPIARRGAIKDEPVDAASLPTHVTGAFIAIEDKRFRTHWGIDPRSIGRAIVANAEAGGVAQGGSTITQQLAKTSFLSPTRSMKRKAQEAIIALWLEAWLTKDEILSRYLSSIYFGDGVYGIRAASRHYFGDEPADLSIGEAAMLAGMVKAPSRLAPTQNLAGARARSKIVISEMAAQGFISRRDADNARLARPAGREARLPTGTYFADWAANQATRDMVPEYGLKTIRTTLDADLQRVAVRAATNGPIGDAQVALVAMRPSGEVVAMIGGRSYKKSPFNRATQARRQPGSSFKLFVYLAALRAGWSPDDLIDDSPITINGWSPANSDGQYRGEISLREAFARSSNAAAVRLAERVGRQNIIRTARELGITADLENNPSLSLGTAGVSLMEMTAAYAAVYAGKYPVTVTGLQDGLNAEGRDTMLTRQGALDPDDEWAPMLDLLYAAANDGTGKRAALRSPTFGKTGTSQENRDAVFIGFAGNLVVGVWVGHDDNRSLGAVSGGTAPARIWKNFMQGALAIEGARGPRLPSAFQIPDRQPQSLPAPDSIDVSVFERIARELERIFN